MLEDKFKRADLFLLLLYLLISAIIIFRVNVEGTGYTTPDSVAYLNAAQNLTDGYGFYETDTMGNKTRLFTKWPVGYPTLIFLTTSISGLDVFWASKTLNLLLLAGIFLFLRCICHSYSFVLASICCSYTLLEVYSFTWSEAPFLLLLLLLAHLVLQVYKGIAVHRNATFIYLVCLGLFLLRYAGIFSLGVPIILCIYFRLNKNHKPAKIFFITSILTTLSVAGYLIINHKLSGFATGLDRMETETESGVHFLLMSLKGLFNEFLIIREYRPQNQPDYLLYITALIQLAVITFITFKVKRHYNFWQELRQNNFSMICIGLALLYLAAIVAMRLVSHFDALDYRLLAPFSFPFLIGLVYALVSLPDKHKDIIQAKYALFTFFLLSLFLNLPKKFILQQLQQIL
ncbi:hypothetical protein K3G39_14305 [Pontibacter sp. HSC-14F20]|uniref:hypothetical protein n=1 Tax=Pontibacter sp. HSC-14F20 TaxID=2864136 RepID=UPI001C737E8C|nr:hypothetical protein [Pontibacter sp. HSC-14F20]MBX0334411.1 hypothetical protein [Pontibacter sp. HSC-14F20]